jgi:KipI family sensor histidine kinase inhibitor
MRMLPCGDVGVLIELDDLAEVLGLQARLVNDPPPGVVELVPATRTLLVRIDPTVTSVTAAARALEGVEPDQGGDAVGDEHVEIPVVYDGEDLEEVARLTGLEVAGVIEAHTEQTWTVAFAGFAPGFGYLVGDDDRLHVPRRSEPRSKVPAGAVGLADEFSGVYPRSSPGGWQLIGRTELTMWDVDRDPPALLEPGTGVRFVDVG